MANVNVQALETELIGLVKELDAFTDKGFSIFSLDDLENLVSERSAELPLVGVGYDGMERQANQIDNKASGATAAAYVNVQFLIVLAVSHRQAGSEDKKQDAMALLDQIRNKVLGYKGVEGEVQHRGWRFIGERPEPEASGDGLIFYVQVWQVAFTFTGTNS